MGLVRAGIAAGLVALAAAPAAQAAYAPKLDVKVDPATPKAPAALTTTVTQASGETASKTVHVAFPSGFSPNRANITPCTPAQEQQDQCPPESQIGDASANTQLGSLGGPVYFETDGSHITLVVYLKGFGGLIDQKVLGSVTLGGGRIQTTFDNLPNTQTTLFRLSLRGGDKALSLTPGKCGQSTFDAAFTSQNGEQATGQSVVDIEGCAKTPVVSQVDVSPKKFRAVRRFSDTQRSGYGTTISWTLSEATNGTRIVVQKRVRSHWRRAGSFVGSGDQGQNRVKWDGRLRKKPLAPGSYRFVLQTTGKSGLRSDPVTAGFTVAR
ncbi:MAG: hypothetical protein ACJ76Z_02345 [Thermoleophilaceae bacterium]